MKITANENDINDMLQTFRFIIISALQIAPRIFSKINQVIPCVLFTQDPRMSSGTHLPNSHSLTPKFSFQNSLFLRAMWCWVLQTLLKCKNQIGKAKGNAGNNFFDFLCKLMTKNQYSKCTNMDFSQNFQM